MYSAITSKSEDKYVVKVFNWSEFHLFEMTLLQNPYFNNIQIFELYHNLPAKRPAIAEVKDLMRVEELSEA